MKTNLPVTQRACPFPTGRYLVSKTDLNGVITDVNDAFVELSGFAREELIGQNHHIVRHPDMPPWAFADLWRTVREGLPWRGMVKNRTKSGDYYWVDAFVVPLRREGRTAGYMSVRSEPTLEQIRAAEALYRQPQPPRPAQGAGGRMSLRARLVAAMVFVALLLVGGATIGVGGQWLSNRALESVYRDRLEPATQLSEVMTILGDNRSQIMLGLQHNPANPLAGLHDHALDMHIEATLQNRAAANDLLKAVLAHQLTAGERELADKFSDARERYSKEGVNAAREALKRGEFDEANRLLLTRINPLYKEMNAAGNALLKQLLATAKQEFEEAQARYNLILLLSVLGTAAAVGLAAFGSWLLERAIVRPMRRAMAIFANISQGVLTDDVEIRGRDEAGRLLCELAAMQVQLKVLLDDVAGASRTIETRCLALEQEMQRVVAQSLEQHDRASGVAAATEEFSQSIRHVAENARCMADAANATSAIVQESDQNIGRSLSATGRVVEAVQSSSATIAALNRSILRIGDITHTIEGIAGQTNLLALNAAIEAARAGDSGRGFAVVADEVRKLAERTTSSTGDISAMVTEIQEITRKAVTGMELAVAEVDGGMTMLRDSVAGLGKISEATRDVTDRSEEIAQAAREQAAASEGVAQHMEELSGLVDGNTAAAKQAKAEVDGLMGTARELKTLVERFQLFRR